MIWLSYKIKLRQARHFIEVSVAAILFYISIVLMKDTHLKRLKFSILKLYN